MPSLSPPRPRRGHRRHALLAVLLVALPGVLASAQETESPKRSSFGEYEGWSEPRFEGWVTHSVYVTMRDGVQIAVDLTRPAVDGVATEEALPVVWTHSRYHRNPLHAMGAPQFESAAAANPALHRLLRHGYVVAAACVRGGGASTGRFEGLFSENETTDAVELIAWFREQPWCDGNIGMYGGSYLGITQYMAASRAPEGLKAIIPDVACFDFYETFYPGGVFREDMVRHWTQLTRRLDLQSPVEQVDTDEDGSILAQARQDHQDNWPVLEGYRSAPFRDSVSELHEWSEHGPSPFLDEVNESEVAIYHFNGWFDIFAADTTLWFANYEGPQRMMMGDWSHAQMTPERARCSEIEQLRWFDRWLKGIENGIDDEPPIEYQLMMEPGESRWVSAEFWPPLDTRTQTLHLRAEPSGTVDGVGDHSLATEAGLPAQLEYRVDPTTTTGTATRWDNAVAAAPVMDYSGLAENDRKALCFTTAPLEEDWTVVGHPVVQLYLSSSTGDADLHVLLEEVDEKGDVRYVTEGVLRASLRKTGEAPYDNLGLPYQRCHQEDAEPLPMDRPALVQMDLQPAATVFNAGHRLRLVIFGADADNTLLAPTSRDATIGQWLGGEHDSCLVLPVGD